MKRNAALLYHGNFVQREKNVLNCSHWGTPIGCVPVAGTCSRFSRRLRTPWGSLGRNVRSLRSCSTCCRSHIHLRATLERRYEDVKIQESTYETCVRSRRKSNRSCLGLRHSHRRRRRSRRRRSYRHTHRGSSERCVRPYRTVFPISSVLHNDESATYLIAFLGSALATTDGATALGTFTADVAALAAPVASLAVLDALGAVTAYADMRIRWWIEADSVRK